jgi:hypothetical protein
MLGKGGWGGHFCAHYNAFPSNNFTSVVNTIRLTFVVCRERHIMTEQNGLSSNASDLYSGGDRFEFQSNHRLFSVRIYSVHLGKYCRDGILN